MTRIMLAIMSVLLLVACNIDNQAKIEEEETVEANKEYDALAENEVDMAKKLNELNINEFELEVEYSGNKEYKAEIYKKYDGSHQVSIKNELSNTTVTGQEAFDDLFPKLQQLHVNSDSKQGDLVEQVLQAFDLPSDYEEFEVEIEFTDGKKVEVNRKN